MNDKFLEDVSNMDIEDFLEESIELSKCLEAIVHEGVIKRNQATDIRNQLFNEYKVGKVLEDGLIIRLLFLVANASANIDTNSLGKISHFMGEEGVCPYCTQEVDGDDITCKTCGYNLEYDEEIEDIDETEVKELLTDLLVTMTDMDEDTANALLNPPDDYYAEDEDENSDIDDFCYRLDESLEPSFGGYDLCIYSVLERLQEMGNLRKEVKFYRDLHEVDTDEKDVFNDIINNGYCTKTINHEYWDIISDRLTKKDLKNILKRDNLKITGNRKKLIERIRENVNLEEIEFNSIPSYKRLDYTIYLTTPKGLKYLEENKYIKLYDYCLFEYHYDEYKNYIFEHDDISLIDATISYLKLHEEKSFKEKEQTDYLEHIMIQSDVYDFVKDYDNYFKAEVKLLVTKLNPIDVDERYCYVDYLLQEATIENLDELVNDYDYDLEKAIRDAYDEINYTITIPLKVLIDNLPNLRPNKDIGKLDKEWKEKYLPSHVLTDLNSKNTIIKK